MKYPVTPASVLFDELLDMGEHLIGVEIGVLQGKNLINMVKHLTNFDKWYGIDPWIDFTDGRKWFRKNMDEAKRKFKDNNKVELIQAYSEDAVKDFKDASVDFVFVDGNHDYEYVKKDIELWMPKIVKGGMMAGDDYKRCEAGVIQAVDEMLPHKKILGEDVWMVRV